jgi:DmsE family decaheme c-type cytochrome
MLSRVAVAARRLLALAVIAALTFMGGAILSPQDAQAQAKAAPGPEACAGCHEDTVKRYRGTVHGAQGNLRGPAGTGECTVCHGDGTEHIKANGGRGTMKNLAGKSASLSADDKSAVCQSCHAGGSKRTHWDTSTHQARGNGCTSCHTMHSTDKVLTKITQPEVCFACHKQQRVDANRTFRHPMLEGKVACSDCHNVHGSIGRALMKRDNVVDTCYQCHAEKRGPFVHQHDPVTEDCGICHNPHGTVEVSMLKQRMPFLCQSCHTPHGAVTATVRGGPGATAIPGPLTGKNSVIAMQGRSCLNCHTQIHGGNNPGFAQPTPQFMFR